MFRYQANRNQKENLTNSVIFYGKWRPKGEKMPEKLGETFISANRTAAILGTDRPQKLMRHFEVVGPPKILITGQKI